MNADISMNKVVAFFMFVYETVCASVVGLLVCHLGIYRCVPIGTEADPREDPQQDNFGRRLLRSTKN